MDKKNTSKSDDKDSTNTDCTVCLQPFVQPVKLPCSHVFCFLCAKGLAWESSTCALCRKIIPSDYMSRPQFVVQQPSGSKSASYQWYYQGQSGWWQYDYQISGKIEHAYQNDEERCEVLIAGEIYVIDFEKKRQILKSNPTRSRQIKRDLNQIPCKGVAGVRTSLSSKTSFQKNDDDSQDMMMCKTASTPESVEKEAVEDDFDSNVKTEAVESDIDSNNSSSDCILIIPKKEEPEVVDVEESMHEDIERNSSSNSSPVINENSSSKTTLQAMDVDEPSHSLEKAFQIANSRKRKGNDLTDFEREIIKKPDSLCLEKDEFDIYSNLVAVKLRKMNAFQRTYAQFYVNEIITKGELDLLHPPPSFNNAVGIPGASTVLLPNFKLEPTK